LAHAPLPGPILQESGVLRAYLLIKTIDNPDQRISDDVNTFTKKSLTFLLEIVGAVLQLIAFSGILWAISKTLVMFLGLYAIFGTLVTFGVFGKPLIALNFQQLRREADFRFSLIRIRENAEAIAFYQGEAREASHVKQRFAEVFDNYKNLIRRTLGLNLFQYGYSFVTLIFPCIIIAPRVLSGELEVGRVRSGGGRLRGHAERADRVRGKFRSPQRLRRRHRALAHVFKVLGGTPGRTRPSLAIRLVGWSIPAWSSTA
jgi:ABC-type uncharacterized transport system fused permease/ATPase subunit